MLDMRVAPIALVCSVLFAACAGSGAGVANGADPARDTCESVVRAGVADETREHLEHATNVLDYERIWRAGNAGIVPGTISGNEVRARIRARNAELLDCYDAALDRLPSGQGRVVVRFVVDDAGQVPAVTITSNDFKAPDVGCCVAKRVAQWSFPNPVNGDFVVVEYPFVVKMSR